VVLEKSIGDSAVGGSHCACEVRESDCLLREEVLS
jgi:hypothetical protein